MDISTRVDTFPEPWKPEAGDKLVGEVIAIDERDGEYGIYPVVTVLIEDDTEIAFHAFHTVAKRELARQKPDVGDQIAVKYFGRDEEKGYERYRLAVDKPQKAIDWDAVGANAEAELAGDGSLPLPDEDAS